MAISPVILAKLLAGANITAGQVRPLLMGRPPFTNMTAGRRPAIVHVHRAISAALAGGSVVAPAALFGADLPRPDALFASDVNGRLVPGVDPDFGASIEANAGQGSVAEKVRAVAGQNATANTTVGVGYIKILNGGAGYTSAPAVTFSGGGTPTTAATGTAVINPSGEVVGITITNAGAGYTSAPTVTIAAPDLASGRQAIAAASVSGIATISTHIPYVAPSPTTEAGYAYFVEVRGVLLPVSTTVAVIDSAAAMRPEQHLSAGAASCTVATGTHQDGTTAICVFTLNTGSATNAANLGVAPGDEVTFYRLRVRKLAPSFNTVGVDTQQIVTRPVMWVGIESNGTTDTTTLTVDVEPLQ